MTAYEIKRLLAEPFLPALGATVRHDLKLMLGQTPPQSRSVLDVGGRKSPYTIGLPCEVTIVDLPRENEIQQSLNLGLTGEAINGLKRCRSNVRQIFLQDITTCTLPAASFDGIVSVEVIEHVVDDAAFVAQLERVLKPGGWLYITTPNGDYLLNEPPNKNPDHVRHYKRHELSDLLSRYFDKVEVNYGISTSRYYHYSLESWAVRRPLSLLRTMASGFLSQLESHGLENRHYRTAHLIAKAWKAPSKIESPDPDFIRAAGREGALAKRSGVI